MKVILVHIDFPDYSAAEHLDEFIELARSAGADPVVTITGLRQAPDPKFFMGSGKAQELQSEVQLHQAELIIFNHELSPAQERNLERFCQCRVIDRTGLILDIFAQRARTFEGKLQVELAQLHYLSTRLVRGWTHLERQKGGIGLRGPGETQLETDRRLLRNRIKSIDKRLEKVQQQRYQSRQARRRATIPTVAIVGYTNAGKSTLFNLLAGAESYAADKLFATLDPLMRRIDLPGAGGAVIADTVGFIRHLPHDLIDAFKATLEETRDANLLLHVIDISDPNWRMTVAEVNDVLATIGADHIPQLMVFNKIDLIDSQAKLARDDQGKPNKVWLSAQTGKGLSLCQEAIAEQLYGDPVYRSLILSPDQGKLRAQLYQTAVILSERIDEKGNWLLSVRLSRTDFERLIGPLATGDNDA